MSRILIIIPALNEECSLPAVLADLARHAPACDVLVVDDGSTDATGEVALNGGATVVTLPFNLGIGAALRTGFRYARDHRYDQAVQFDADGQHLAPEIQKLLDRLASGADMVVGTRFAEHTGYEVSRTRYAAMAMLRIWVSFLTGRRCTDTSSGFRAFNGRAIALFSRTYPREYMDSVEALVLAAYGGLRVDEVASKMTERAAGVPSNRNVRLVYNYLRLLSVLVATASFQARRARGLQS